MASGVLPSLAVAPLGDAAALPDCLEDLHLELDRALQLNTELLSQCAALRRGERSNIDEQIRGLGHRIDGINLNIKACIEANEAKAATRIQAAFHGYLFQADYLKANEAKAATCIQAAFRGYLCQMDYLRLLDLEVHRAAARLQGAVRSFLVRRHLALVPVDRDLCPLDPKNFFAHSVDGDSIDVVYCYRDLYNKCKMVMPTKDHPVGLEPSSHGKSAKGFYNPPRVTANPPPASPAGGAVVTHANDPTTRSTAPGAFYRSTLMLCYVTAPTPTTYSTTGPPLVGGRDR